MKLFKKISFAAIIKNHVTTLRDANTNKMGSDDLVTFIIIPVIFSAVMLYFKIYLKDSAINIIITTLSILVGLLFNVVVLIFDLINKDNKDQAKNLLLKEILSNIAFTILLSVVAIIFTLCTFINNCYATIIFNAIVYFFLVNFLMTVMMILKRMFVLFHDEIDKSIKNS